ncbi:MAG: hypothetical protein H7144_14155 [Burkholderiales bacterium]|nr:hypothetical protein [Phycisphaerae bacterium]
MMEVTRRYRLELLDFFKQIDVAGKKNLPEVLTKLKGMKPGDDLPPDALDLMILYFSWGQLVQRWYVDAFASERHASLPGSGMNPDELTIDGVGKKYDSIASDGMFKAITATLIQKLGADGYKNLSTVRHRKTPVVDKF